MEREAEAEAEVEVPGSQTPLEEPGGVDAKPAEEEERARSKFAALKGWWEDGVVVSLASVSESPRWVRLEGSK